MMGSRSSGGSMGGDGGLGPIEGAFEKRRMLMEPKEMLISSLRNGPNGGGKGGNGGLGQRHQVTVSAFRGVHDRLVYEVSDALTGIVRYFDIPAELILEVGRDHPALMETKQTARVEKLAALLDLRGYFGESDNVVAKMFWWQGKESAQGNLA